MGRSYGREAAKGDGETITYNAFNKPLTITGGGNSSTFSYGANLMRYRQETPSGSTIYYIDKLMEIETLGSTVDYRHYLGDVAILTKTGSLNDPSPGIQYLFRDRLGSTSVIGDEYAAIVEYRGFDAFGKPRNGNWTNKAPATINSTVTDRGFTDHEHLDDWQLIHMNGRGYDYNLGRFLSVDPFIQDPGNSQSINGYSYIGNNPLSGTDPTGYKSETTKETKPIYETPTGTRIKQQVGTETVSTTADTQTGEVTNITSVRDYKGQVTGVSMDFSNGKPTRITNFSANLKTGKGSAEITDFGSAATIAGGNDQNRSADNSGPSTRQVSRTLKSGETFSWTVTSMLGNTPESAHGLMMGVQNSGQGYEDWLSAGGISEDAYSPKTIWNYPLFMVGTGVAGRTMQYGHVAGQTLKTLRIARSSGVKAVSATETATLRGAVAWQIFVQNLGRYTPTIVQFDTNFGLGYRAGSRVDIGARPLGRSRAAQWGFWIGYSFGAIEATKARAAIQATIH